MKDKRLIKKSIKKICYCFNVSVEDIERAIENGADTFEKVQSVTNCGKGCGSCLAEAKAVVDELLKKYAKLAVEMGVNLKENDTLCINTPIETAEFARFIAESAYAVGAKDVIVNYNDAKLNKIRLSNSSIDTLSNLPEWFGETYNYYARNGACFISISASDPDAFSGVPMENIAAYSKARSIALKEYSEAATANKVRWCVLSYPTLAWAKKVFPDATDAEALTKLGDAIISAVRVDTADPVEAWNNHNATLAKSLDFMNKNNFKSLHLKSSNGTDLTVELPENHYWAGGSEADTKGILFNANMPTEEVFTLPKRTGVNGIVFSSKPLSYNGNLINDFSIHSNMKLRIG